MKTNAAKSANDVIREEMAGNSDLAFFLFCSHLSTQTAPV